MDRRVIDEEGVFKLTNFQSHPTNSSYVVFHFPSVEMANDFEIKLAAAAIPFERDNPEDGEQEKYYFGIRRMYFKKAKKINYLVYGHHRTPFIGNKIYKWIILGFTIAIIGLAIVGAIVSNFK
jgi:hypothetical protein